MHDRCIFTKKFDSWSTEEKRKSVAKFCDTFPHCSSKINNTKFLSLKGQNEISLRQKDMFLNYSVTKNSVAKTRSSFNSTIILCYTIYMISNSKWGKQNVIRHLVNYRKSMSQPEQGMCFQVTQRLLRY